MNPRDQLGAAVAPLLVTNPGTVLWRPVGLDLLLIGSVLTNRGQAYLVARLFRNAQCAG